MTATTNTIDMTALNCPYGCGNKLVVNEDWGVLAASCPVDEGNWGHECKGEGQTYTNADEVCNTANDRVSAYKKALGFAYAKRAGLNARIEAQEKRLEKAIKLSDRISNQHG
jgi:hypothetical protein